MKKKYKEDRKLKVKTGGGVYSKDGKRRQQLTVSWETAGNKKAIVIGINPSKANDTRSDSTLTRTARFLNMYGVREFLMLNIFESYATKQKDIDFSSKSDFTKFRRILKEADIIFIAWGVEKKYLQEKEAILKVLKKYEDKLYCVIREDGKYPLHPRCIRYKHDMKKYIMK